VTALLASIATNVVGAAFVLWMLRRVQPMIREIVSLRSKVIDAGGEILKANGKVLVVGEQLIETQTKLRDALREASFHKEMREIERRVAEANVAVANRRAEIAEAASSRVKAAPIYYAAGLDDRTKNLIRLAVDNPEPNEGAAAALIVCRRLKEGMDP